MPIQNPEGLSSGESTQAARTSQSIPFFHPDYTVGPGFAPGQPHEVARGLASHRRITTGRELACASPCPEGLIALFTFQVQSYAGLFGLSNQAWAMALCGA